MKNIIKNLDVTCNVSIRIIDEPSGDIVSEHIGHNSATNTLLEGIGHYLTGDGILNQGYSMLNAYLPQYISLGTMGLINQDEDEDGLPSGIGDIDGTEEERFTDYMKHSPGFGADGYDASLNNGRLEFGLGLPADKLEQEHPINCELISDMYHRFPITFRDIISEARSENPETIDVVYSAFISTGALSSFKESGKDYIFITEAGLWSSPYYTSSSFNGMLAGYRIKPADRSKWDMTIADNRQELKKSIIRVGPNQVVQVVWKIQLGSIHE